MRNKIQIQRLKERAKKLRRKRKNQELFSLLHVMTLQHVKESLRANILSFSMMLTSATLMTLKVHVKMDFLLTEPNALSAVKCIGRRDGQNRH
jgi:hypothetical protein